MLIGFAGPRPSVRQSELPLQVECGACKDSFDIVFDDAFLSKDLRVPVGEPRLCSKDTDVEVVDDRTALLLQCRAQHALELFRCLLRFVRSRIVLDRFHVSPPLQPSAHFARFPRARAHPGGNLAGSSRLARAIAGKWLLAPRRDSEI